MPAPHQAPTVTSSRSDRLWTPAFALVLAITFCGFLIGQGCNAGTSVYLQRMGGATTLAGVGAMVFSLAAALSRLFAGPAADARGRRLVMLVGAFTLVGGTAGPLMGNDGPWFILWRACQGLGFSAITTAAATAAADVLPYKRLGEGISYSGLGQALAMAIGPAMALALIATDVPASFYLALCAVSVITVGLVLACRYERHPENLPLTSQYRQRWQRGAVPRAEGGADEPATTNGESAEEPSQGDPSPQTSPQSLPDASSSRLKTWLSGVFEPTALHGAIPLMVIATAYCFSIFFMGTFGTTLGVTSPGFYYTTTALAMVVVRLTSGRLMDRVAPLKIMGVGCLFALICYGAMAACTFMEAGAALDITFYAAGIANGVSMGLCVPINQAMAVKLSPPNRWGAANGLFFLLYDVSNGVASVVFGAVIVAFGYGVTLVCVLSLIVLAFGVAALCYPKDVKA